MCTRIKYGHSSGADVNVFHVENVAGVSATEVTITDKLVHVVNSSSEKRAWAYPGTAQFF